MRLQGRTGMLLAFVLGLAIATAGTATAAKLITGKEIKNGSIARKDLSTGVRAELSERSRPGPQGVAGPQGPAGQRGAKGDRGAPGVVPAPEEPIEVTSFLNDWVIFGANGYEVRYWKDAFDVVHLMGGLKNGIVSVGIASVPIFRLPEGYRPTQVQYFPVVSTDDADVPIGGAYVEVCGPTVCDADEVGNVSVFGADNAYFSLDGITFRAG